MYREFFLRSPLLSLPLLALVIFMAVFASVLFRVFRRPAPAFDAEARLPLAGDDEDEKGGAR